MEGEGGRGGREGGGGGGGGGGAGQLLQAILQDIHYNILCTCNVER